LAHLRPDLLKQESQMCRDRVVSQNGMSGLKEIAQAENCKKGEEREWCGKE
jgi:hypothetical protein